MPEEYVTAVIPVRELNETDFLFMATKKGTVKKTSVSEFRNLRKNGLQAIGLREDDDLIEVKYTNSQQEIYIATKKGMCIRFNESDVRPTGRTAAGVRGIRLSEGDEVIGMQLRTQGDSMLIASANGIGKRTSVDDFNLQKRGGKGVKCYKITPKTGDVIGFKAVNEEDEIMLITTEGIIIKTSCESISMRGRITSGVKLMNLDEGVQVASIAKVKFKEDEEENPTENEIGEESGVGDNNAQDDNA